MFWLPIYGKVSCHFENSRIKMIKAHSMLFSKCHPVIAQCISALSQEQLSRMCHTDAYGNPDEVMELLRQYKLLNENHNLKLAELKLKSSKVRFRYLFDVSFDCICDRSSPSNGDLDKQPSFACSASCMLI